MGETPRTQEIERLSALIQMECCETTGRLVRYLADEALRIDQLERELAEAHAAQREAENTFSKEAAQRAMAEAEQRHAESRAAALEKSLAETVERLAPHEIVWRAKALMSALDAIKDAPWLGEALSVSNAMASLQISLSALSAPAPQPQTGDSSGALSGEATSAESNDETADVPPGYWDALQKWMRGEALNGMVLVPREPTEAMWDGLARDIMMWMDCYTHSSMTPYTLFRHLKQTGRAIPQWLRDEPEMRNMDHVPSKGTRVVIIYKAMLSASGETGTGRIIRTRLSTTRTGRGR